MTEVEWQKCKKPNLMLEFVKGKASQRKLRLLACSYCRRISRLLDPGTDVQTLDIAERFADAAATLVELRAAKSNHSTKDQTMGAWLINGAMRAVTHQQAWWAVRDTIHCVLHAVSMEADAADTDQPFKSRNDPSSYTHLRERCIGSEAAAEADLMRCVFTPFGQVGIDRRRLASNNGTVASLAQAIYDERAFERMPILADALEDAGCTNQDILLHCRSLGEHARGCWVVDLLLGKK